MTKKLPISLVMFVLLVLPHAVSAQLYSGVLPAARATDWTQAGLPGDVPPDIANAWTQSGSTVTSCGSSGTPVSPSSCGISSALSGCGTNHYVGLGTGDFYLNNGFSIPSNCVLRGAGANATRLHFSAPFSCSGINSLVCIGNSNYYVGLCTGGTLWPCPNFSYNGATGVANWTAKFGQGTSQIVLDNVTGITTNLTPITIDQCDVGYSGTASTETCTATSGVITAASVYSGGGGTGYAVNDTGTITGSLNFGTTYGSGATYTVSSVSGGVVTGITISNGGGGYTYSSSASQAYSTTSATSGSGTGLKIAITGVSAYDNSGLFSCAVTMICTYLDPSNNSRPARSQQEVYTATAISGSGPYTVTLNHPIIHPNWASSQAPEAFWPTSGTVTNEGVENVELDGSTITNGGTCGSNTGCVTSVTVCNADKIWIYGISSNYSNYFHINMTYVVNSLVANSYFYWTANAGTESYGIGSSTAVGLSLFENNIMQGIVDAVNMNANCAGCVVAYNFAVNGYDSAALNVMFASYPNHSADTDYLLYEGNIGSSSYQDNSHGPHFLDTYHRNYFNGYEANCPATGCTGGFTNVDTIPVAVGAFSRYNNYIGNVLGTTGYHTVYQCLPSSSSQQYCSTDTGSSRGVVHIWDVGFSAQGGIDYTNAPTPEPNDTLTASSFMRWGNYDVVRAAVSWCGNSGDTGWSTTCKVAGVSTSEIPTGDPNFPVSVPTLGDTSAGQGNLPPSLYRATRPSWFVTAWPPAGPDVSGGNILLCTSGTYKWSLVVQSTQCAGGASSAAVAGHAYSNPAMNCYLNIMRGAPDGTGNFLSFNAASCYSAAPVALGALFASNSGGHMGSK